MKIFQYGAEEIAFLKSKDKKLAAVIDCIGHIERATDDDLFSSVVHHIVGQQISTKAQSTIWQRMQNSLGAVDAKTLLAAGEAEIHSFGVSFRKAEYIIDFARKVEAGEFSLDEIKRMNDDDAAAALISLKGVGVWTAEMILLFCLQRKNIFSFGDLAIHRGLRMVYRHREIDRKRFERYRRRFSPYCSVASLYLWGAAGGAVPGLSDPGEKSARKNSIS